MEGACLGSNYSARSAKPVGTGIPCQQCEYRKGRSSGARNHRKRADEGTTASVWMGESKGCCPNIGRCISISNGSRQQTLRKLKIWIKITDRFISACYFYGTTQIEKASVLSFVVTHLWTGTFYAPPDVFSLKSSNILSSRSISSFSGFFVNSDFTRESKRELSVKSSRKD